MTLQCHGLCHAGSTTQDCVHKSSSVSFEVKRERSLPWPETRQIYIVRMKCSSACVHDGGRSKTTVGEVSYPARD